MKREAITVSRLQTAVRDALMLLCACAAADLAGLTNSEASIGDSTLMQLVGARVEFPSLSENKWQYLYHFYKKPVQFPSFGNVNYKSLVGKQGSVTKVFKDSYLHWWAEIALDDAKASIYTPATVGYFEDIFFPAELEAARMLVGKKFYWRNRRGNDRGLDSPQDPIPGESAVPVTVWPMEVLKLVDVTGPRGWSCDCRFLSRGRTQARPCGMAKSDG